LPTRSPRVIRDRSEACEGGALPLETTDDIRTYSHYDVLGIRLQRYDLSLTDLSA
jgi:hypothetical protein